MRLVVADTSPLRYLIQIGQIDLLPRLFESIYLLLVVADELGHPSAPPASRAWMQQAPGWLEVIPVVDVDDPALARWIVANGQPLRSVSPSGQISFSLMSEKALLSP